MFHNSPSILLHISIIHACNRLIVIVLIYYLHFCFLITLHNSNFSKNHADNDRKIKEKVEKFDEKMKLKVALYQREGERRNRNRNVSRKRKISKKEIQQLQGIRGLPLIL